MATVTKLDNLKIGDTPTFSVTLSPVGTAVNWTGTTFDAALTAISAPVDNSGAVAVRTAQAITVNADGTATASMTLTTGEANNLVVGTYHFEVQLKQGGLVSTVYTATLPVVQDYVK